jgi:hypothetical protein
MEFFSLAFIYLWVATAVSALAGTIYWFRIPRHAPNKDPELVGLMLMYWLLGILSAIYGAFYWLVKSIWEGVF